MKIAIKHKNFYFVKTCDIIVAMGKVIINETDATKTARKGSSADTQRGTHPRERAHLDLSKKKVEKEPAEVKVTTKKVTTTKVAADKTSKTAAKPAKKATTKAIAVKTSEEKPKETKGVARTVKPGSKSAKITKYAKTESAVQIIARDTPRQLGAGTKATKPEMGMVVRNRNIDPELALMASRSQAMEKSKINARANAGRSMSGMVSNRSSANNARNNNSRNSYDANGNPRATAKAPVEETAGFTKIKSALIGVGVAVVVAVVGFAGIALFGEKKNMCTVQFESNGGSVVEGAEFVCGRTVEQPDNPTKDGFTFEGWIYEGDPFDFGTELYKNATLVAKWKAEDGVEVVTVKFDTDGGSVIKDIDLAKGRKLTPPSAPTKIGYVFEDWYLGDEPFDFDQPIEENITLKAKWERRDASSGSSSTSSANRVTSLTASKTNLTIEVGKSENITINVLPSTADYSLAAVSGNSDVVECSVNKTTVTCTAKGAGTASVRIRDVNSGNMTNISVIVPSDDVPPVTDPNPDPEPDVPVEPDVPPVPTYYTVKIEYVDGTTGEQIAAPFEQSYEAGKPFKVVFPVIEGYKAEYDYAEEVVDRNLNYIIKYTPIALTVDPAPEPETPETTE